MNREFSVSIWNKVFYLLLAAAVFCTGIYLFTVPQQHIAVYIFPLIMIIVGVLITLSIFKGRIIVTENSICRINLIYRKEILFTNIKGFRIDNKVIKFQTILPNTKFSIARYDDFGKISEFITWLNNNFTNLDEEEYKEHLNEILSDNELGLSEDDRNRKLKQAQNIAFLYNIGGVALFVAGLVFREKIINVPANIIMLVYPVCGLLIIFKSRGLIRFYSKKASPYYHIFIGLYTSIILLSLTSIFNYEILVYNNIWLLIMPACAFGITATLANKHRNEGEEKGSWILLIIISIFFGYSCLIQVNCMFDNSTEQIYKTKVINHFINHGSGTHPYIILEVWGPQTKTKEIQVSRDLYERSPIGSSITIHLKKGLFHIPWYKISM